MQWPHEVLARQGAGFCIYDLAGRTSPCQVTAELVYVRLHGPASQAYRGSYSDEALAAWARRFQAWAAEGRTVRAHFDNDQAGYAVQDAGRLRELLGG
ncbi:MAG: DUF72 domain-containing protein [Deltaproteobacteria bacterium]|nr:DUF72 domain-containing protein [Deltaproteobacteria bacterium]